MSEKEEWRDVPSYEGYYQASSLGRVRSLDRWVTTKDQRRCFYKGRVLSGHLSSTGYRRVTIKRNGSGGTLNVSQVVAMAFLGHKPCGFNLVVDHIDGNKKNDKINNLRIVTNRANSSTCFKHNKYDHSSVFIGVYREKGKDKWRSSISHDGRTVSLGSFKTEIEASNAYKSALSKINDKSFNPSDYKPEYSSKYKGVYFSKRDKTWYASVRIEGVNNHVGSFHAESEAYNAYLKEYRRLCIDTSTINKTTTRH